MYVLIERYVFHVNHGVLGARYGDKEIIRQELKLTFVLACGYLLYWRWSLFKHTKPTLISLSVLSISQRGLPP
jgi:hypothetical protein